MEESAESVLEFWFGPADWRGDARAVAEARGELWWGKSAQVDAEIARRFSSVAAAAAAAADGGALATWARTPRGLLALVLCCDQFPRNIFRGQAAAFAADAKALAFAKRLAAEGADAKLAPIERVFAYLPFEHAESLAEQKRALELFGALAAAAAPAERELFRGYLDFARAHYEIISRFKRFPHRNEILGRESRADELAFLQQPGSAF